MTIRGEILEGAFEAIGIAEYAYALEPSEIASAARRLDAMMAQWKGEGVDLGYTSTAGEPQPDVDMTTPEWADDAIINNLALKIAPSFGKTPLPGVKGDAKRAYSLAVAKTLTTPITPINRVPVSGGGNWWRRWRGVS